MAVNPAQRTRAKRGRRIKRYHGHEAKDALRIVMQHPGAKKVFKKRLWRLSHMLKRLNSVLVKRYGHVERQANRLGEIPRNLLLQTTHFAL